MFHFYEPAVERIPTLLLFNIADLRKNFHTKKRDFSGFNDVFNRKSDEYRRAEMSRFQSGKLAGKWLLIRCKRAIFVLYNGLAIVHCRRLRGQVEMIEQQREHCDRDRIHLLLPLHHIEPADLRSGYDSW